MSKHPVFTEWIEEQIDIIQMWVEKKGDTLPETAAYLVYALEDLQVAHKNALEEK